MTFGDLPARTPAERQEASKHLRYEIAMLRSTAKLLLEGVYPRGETRNAILEAFTVHARSLIDFFFPPPDLDKRGMYVWHYVSPDRWAASAPPKPWPPAALRDIHSRTGTEVAHLSFNRLRKLPDEWDWDVRAIWEAFAPVIEAFCREVQLDQLTKGWVSYKAATLIHGRDAWKLTTTAETTISPPIDCSTPAAQGLSLTSPSGEDF